MGYDRHNAALVACCVFAILAAAAFLPAAGYGDYPDQDAVSDDHYLESGPGTDGGNGSSDSDGDATDPNSDASDSPDENERENGSTTDDQEDSDDSDSSADPDDSDDGPDDANDENESTAAGDTAEPEDGTSDGGADLIRAAVVALVGLVVVSPMVLLWRGTHPARAPGNVDADVALPDGFLPRLRFRLKRIPQVTMTATIGFTRVTPAIVDSFVRTGRAAGSALGMVGHGLGRGLRSAVVSLPTGIAGALGSLGGRSRSFSLSGGIASLFDGFSLPRREAGSWTRSTAARGDGRTTDDAETEADPEPQTVEEAWARLTELVSRRRDRSKTPGEYASAAVDAGFPESAISTLTETFREVRYGNYPATDARVRRARAAYERIVSRHDGRDGE
ncbi:DUF4129 domain-containing protein [Natronosalvus halobius]|uniref:DUF4129 domain-containing protein n=1 Tax=Natronosalvus halobius TaxID=2953746 RepID=UPI00209D9925|nr:DUF4129 domain-containing protein [Natronosalvus halobius]USZ72862.1 DUF4129 domain-containing protein [Natronosalvus halobius]